MAKTSLKCGAAILAIGLGWGPNLAFAQDSGTADTATGGNADIVVTAQKREQRLIDVPLSLSAVGAEELANAGVSGVQDLAQIAPGLVFSETIGRQTTNAIIRGISPQGFSDPTVQVLVDGFTLGFNRSGNNAQIFDLERVEILRGPQPTLYGRNALGGIINYVTHKPGNEFEGSVRGEVASYGNYRLSGSVGGPIVRDLLAAQVGASYRKSGGYLDNRFDGRNNINDERDLDVRGHLRFTPTDALEMNLTVNYSDTDDACGDCAVAPIGFDVNNPQSFRDIGLGRISFNNFDLTVDQNFPGYFKREEVTAVFNTSYDFGGVTLTSITGAARQDTDLRADTNRLPTLSTSSLGSMFFNVKIRNEGWSEELRLASDGDGPLIWIVGAYAYQNRRRSDTLSNGVGVFARNTVRVTNLAGFANLEYQLSEQFSVIGGLRYDWEKRSLENPVIGSFFERKAGEWLPSATLSFKPTEDVHLYATYTHGYHSGGTNDPAFSPANRINYESEFLTNYEVGVKGKLAGGRMSYSLAAFVMDWTDQQITRQSPVNPVRTYIENAGKSRIKGIEASVFATPTRGLDVNASIALLDAKFIDYIDPISATVFGIDPDLSGNTLSFAPDVTVSAGAQYVFPIGASGWDARLRGDVNMVSDRSFNVTNLLIADGYSVVNLYAGVQNERFQIGLFADNVFDERYLTGGSISASTFPPLLTVGKPRIYGIRGEMRF
jgi:iron complex outermembrane receptor protein